MKTATKVRVKQFVINLPHRADRLSNFRRNNPKFDGQVFSAIDGEKLTYSSLHLAGFDTDKNWRDPILGRTLTRGEIGCFLSHWELWEKCAQGEEEFMIFEDDVVPTGVINDSRPEDYDFLYLSHAEMFPAGATPETPCYPYHLSAYVITPFAAKTLLRSQAHRKIIPCDELLPRMTDKMRVRSVAEPEYKQLSRVQLGSNIEPSSEADYFRDFATHVFTVGDKADRMEKLHKSASLQGIGVRNLLDGEWKGGNMSGPGGGHKLVLLREALMELPDHDVVMFVDGFDVFFIRDLDTIVGRYLSFKKDVVFSAEKQLWPDKSLLFPPSWTSYRYLNSGTFIGRVGELKRMLDFDKGFGLKDDDQLFLQRAFLSGKYNVVLDHECYIFQTSASDVEVEQGRLYNPETRCLSAVYHGNGGDTEKQWFNEVYNKVYPVSAFATSKKFEVVAPDMLLMDFLSPETCAEWIKLSEEHGGWEPHPDDNFPSHDIHLKLLGLWDQVEEHWRRYIAPVCEEYWKPYKHYHLRKAFTMRYTMDTQRTLGHHTDASLVTGSVKLNDDYTGATLVFPRQNFNNSEVPIGKILLFPGQVTHGHLVEPLVEGAKFSATFWTARYEGDTLDP